MGLFKRAENYGRSTHYHRMIELGTDDTSDYNKENNPYFRIFIPGVNSGAYSPELCFEGYMNGKRVIHLTLNKDQLVLLQTQIALAIAEHHSTKEAEKDPVYVLHRDTSRLHTIASTAISKLRLAFKVLLEVEGNDELLSASYPSGKAGISSALEKLDVDSTALKAIRTREHIHPDYA